MNYKVSVIIPVFNAENELEKTIQSIIKQSIGFENIELILVDDNSTDNSRNIVKKYSEQYDNIISYYSKKNHGYPGFGRNMGLKLASSDYIMFIDNDDEYEKDICKNLYETITTENADLVCCGKIVVEEQITTKEHIRYKNGIENNGKVTIKNEDILFFDSFVVWNKIFKKSNINSNKIKFFEDTRLDDRKFTFKYYLNSKKIIYLKNYYGYYWNIKFDSLSHANRIEHVEDMIDCIFYEYELSKNENKLKYFDFRAKNAIIGPIMESSYIQSNKELKNVLIKIHDFEKEINFNGKLDAKWADTINKLILNEHYTMATILLKSLNILRKSTIIRKIIRRIQ